MKNLKLKSTGLTGKKWIKRLKLKGFKISKWAEDVLKSPDFVPTEPEVKYEVVIVPVKEVGGNVTTKMARDYAKSKGYLTPHPETACLIREAISDEDMKEMDMRYVVVMHEPVKDSDGDPSVLCAYRDVDGRWLNAPWAEPVFEWCVDGAFAFLLPQGTQKPEDKTSDLKSLELRIARLEKIVDGIK